MQDALKHIADPSAQALPQVLTSDAAGCRGFTVAPAGSTLLAAAPFSFGLPPVPLRKPVNSLLGDLVDIRRALSWTDDTLYASHTCAGKDVGRILQTL